MATAEKDKPASKMTHEEYLESKGWQLSREDDGGQLWWTDPVGLAEQNQKPKKEKRTIRHNQGGGKFEEQTYEVTVGPRIPWDYKTVEAVAMQRQRDKEASKK